MTLVEWADNFEKFWSVALSLPYTELFSGGFKRLGYPGEILKSSPTELTLSILIDDNAGSINETC